MQYLVCYVWEHHSEEHRIVEGNKAKTECLIIDINVHICVEFVATCVYIHVRTVICIYIYMLGTNVKPGPF